MSVIYVSERALKLLEALARFKYLTTSQFVTLGLFKHKSQSYPVYKDLILGKYAQSLGTEKKPKAFIEKVVFGRDPRAGRLEDIYFLNQYGVNYLVEFLDKDLSKIKYPKNKNSLFSRDYYHRKYCVDFYVYLYLESQKRGFQIKFFYYYFDKVGSTKGKIKLKSQTQIGNNPNNYIISDTVFMLKHGGKESFYITEQHNGKDTGRFIKDLKKHILAMDTEEFVECYKTKKGYRILCVLENESVKKAIIPKLRDNGFFDHFHEYIYFKTNKELEENIFDGWQTIDNKIKSLF